MDTSQLELVRDKFVTDINAVIAASAGVPQASIDNLVSEVSNVDADVVKALPVVPSGLNFDAFKAAMNKLGTDAATLLTASASPVLNQSIVDQATAMVGAVDTFIKGALGILGV